MPTLACASGSFVLTGVQLSLISRRETIGHALFQLNPGQLITNPMFASAGGFALQIYAAGIYRRLACGVGSFALTGVAATFAGEWSPGTTYNPYIAETFTADEDNDSIAARAGVPTQAIDAYRSSTPHWTLIENLRQVARAFGVDQLELKAKVDRSTRSIVKGQTFPSSGRESFARLRNPIHIA